MPRVVTAGYATNNTGIDTGVGAGCREVMRSAFERVVKQL
jgi:hypothetical protein